MAERAPFFAGVDWGTSRLRIWLIDAEGGLLAERRSDRGLLAVAKGNFESILEGELDAMGAPADLPVLICGMAGSRQGWVEVPYLETPVALDRLGQGAMRVAGSRRRVFILPGVARNIPGHEDVMRGEETQIAGATALLASGSHIVCLPGTHSKWATVEDGTLTGFSTFMTGEFFALACEHSILRHSVGPERDVSPENPAFVERLTASLASPDSLLARLFSVRAAGLLSGLGPVDAAAAVSGHLIGSEVGSAVRSMTGRHEPVLLVASGPVAALYEVAFRQAGIDWRPHGADEAVRTGLHRAARACL